MEHAISAAPILDAQEPSQAKSIDFDAEAEISTFDRAPKYNREMAEKRMYILKECDGIFGAELRAWVGVWNAKHPDQTTSYPTIMSLRKSYAANGVGGLLGRYGNRADNSALKANYIHYYEAFKAAFLKEGSPSARSCWLQAIGAYHRDNPDADVVDFPCAATFLRRLNREVPEGSQFLARRGREAWNRKYGFYIDRNRDDLRAGQCYVGDARNVDIRVIAPDGKIVRPWFTAWSDFKTNKFVGWEHTLTDPTSDTVFQSFFWAVTDNGLCDSLLIDNGRIYTCRDFAGNRRSVKIDIDEAKTTAMVGALGIKPHFALPYGAQSKSIERLFRTLSEYLDKHAPGYTGSNTAQKPDCLKDEVAARRLLSFDEYCKLFDDVIRNCYNQLPQEGKLADRSPDQVWAEDIADAPRRYVSEDALKLFCARVSEPRKIDRNGIQLDGIRYWGEWMPPLIGTQVYLRRNSRAWQSAWCFRADSDEYLGRVTMAEASHPLASTDIDRDFIREQMRMKRQQERIHRAYAKSSIVPDLSEKVANMVAGAEAVNARRGYEHQAVESKVVSIARTEMDEIVEQDKEMETRESAAFDSPEQPPLFATEADRQIWERRQQRKIAVA